MGARNKGDQPCWFTTLCVYDIVLNQEQRPFVQIPSGCRLVTITSTAAAATATVSATTAAAAAAAASVFPRFSFIHNDLTTVHVCAVQSLNGFVSTRLHLNERKTPGSSRLTVADDLGRGDNPVLSKCLFKSFGRGCPCKATDKNVLTHSQNP